MADLASIPRAESGEALFLTQLDLVERVIAYVCSRHHLAAADADDFGSFVKLKFVEDDYAVLAKFQGRSSLRTYLTVVIQRLFLDFRNSAWGKWRPSAEAKRAGPLAVMLEQLLVRDGYAFEEACELLRTNHQVLENRAELERLAARLPVRARRQFEGDETLANVPSPDRSPDDAVADQDRQTTATRVSGVLKTLMSRLDARDRLVLVLRFEDGRTVAEIAGLLRLDQKPLYRRVERLLAELRRGLEAAGIDGAAVLQMLESPAVSIEWGKEGRENGMTRPSISTGAHE